MESPGDSAKGALASSIRRMIAPDAVHVLTLLQECPEASLWSEQGLLESVRNGVAWIAEQDGRVAGFLIGRAVADEFEILNMAVEAAYRHQGIASQLMREALNWARVAGAKHIHLEVRARNVAAISLYMRHGFKPVGQREQYYQNPPEDAILLRLDAT